jgi:hypothetical protein
MFKMLKLVCKKNYLDEKFEKSQVKMRKDIYGEWDVTLKAEF